MKVVIQHYVLVSAAHVAYEILRSEGGRHGARLDTQTATDMSADMRAEACRLVGGIATCAVGVGRCAAMSATQACEFTAARSVVESLRRNVASWTADIASFTRDTHGIGDDVNVAAANGDDAMGETQMTVTGTVATGGRASEGGAAVTSANAQPEARVSTTAATRANPVGDDKYRELPPAVRAAADRAAAAVESAVAAAASAAVRACLAYADVEGAATQVEICRAAHNAAAAAEATADAVDTATATGQKEGVHDDSEVISSVAELVLTVGRNSSSN